VKIGILGAGAMGQLFGARLQIAGQAVVFIDAAPNTINVLNSEGIALTTEDGAEHTHASAGLASDFRDILDLVMVFTKGFHTAPALESIGHLIGPETHGITLQNGLGNGVELARHFGPDRTWIGTTDFPVDLERPGVLTTSNSGKVRFGSYSARQASVLPWPFRVLQEARLNPVLEVDILPVIWEKVAFNAALNTLSAVSGQTVGQIGKSKESKELVDHVLAETAAVAASAGVVISLARVKAAITNAYENHGSHKTSMLQDREAGRRTEIDYIGGAVVRLGAEAGVATPVLWTLTLLARQPLPERRTVTPR
jgi:2-dehydropantoate 2-reductase